MIRPVMVLALLLLAACTPRLIPAGPPVAAPALSDDALVMPDGARLPLHRWLPDGPPRAVILALHGFNDAARNFMVDSAPLLTEAGLAVYAYDQRGFGAAPHPGIFAGGPSLAADATAAARLLRARHPGVKLILLGESMGAAVAVLAATGADPPPVDGYVLMAPALWGRAAMPGVMTWTLRVAAHVMPIVGFQASAGGIMATDNLAALRRWGADPLTLKITRVDAAYALVDLMDAAVAAIPACCAGAGGRPVPVLALFGARDQVIPVRTARRVLRGLPAERGRIAFYPEGWHLLLRDAQRAVVAGDLAAWVADPAAPLPSGADAAGGRWLAEPEGASAAASRQP